MDSFSTDHDAWCECETGFFRTLESDQKHHRDGNDTDYADACVYEDAEGPTGCKAQVEDQDGQFDKGQCEQVAEVVSIPRISTAVHFAFLLCADFVLGHLEERFVRARRTTTLRK